MFAPKPIAEPISGILDPFLDLILNPFLETSRANPKPTAGGSLRRASESYSSLLESL